MQLFLLILGNLSYSVTVLKFSFSIFWALYYGTSIILTLDIFALPLCPIPDSKCFNLIIVLFFYFNWTDVKIFFIIGKSTSNSIVVFSESKPEHWSPSSGWLLVATPLWSMVPCEVWEARSLLDRPIMGAPSWTHPQQWRCMAGHCSLTRDL